MADTYYNPKFKLHIVRNEDRLPKKSEGNLSFVKDSSNSVAYIDVSDSERYPILPVWEELD